MSETETPMGVLTLQAWNEGPWRHAWPQGSILPAGPGPGGASANLPTLALALNHLSTWAAWLCRQPDLTVPIEWTVIDRLWRRAATHPEMAEVVAWMADWWPDRLPRAVPVTPPPISESTVAPASAATDVGSPHPVQPPTSSPRARLPTPPPPPSPSDQLVPLPDALPGEWSTLLANHQHALLARRLTQWLAAPPAVVWFQVLALSPSAWTALQRLLETHAECRLRAPAVAALEHVEWRRRWDAAAMPVAARSRRFREFVDATMDATAETDATHAELLHAWLKTWPPIAAADLLPWWRQRRHLDAAQVLPSLPGVHHGEDAFSGGMTVAEATANLMAKADRLRHRPRPGA